MSPTRMLNLSDSSSSPSMRLDKIRKEMCRIVGSGYIEAIGTTACGREYNM